MNEEIIKLHQKLDEIFEKALVIKNSYEETSIFNEIKILPNFPHVENRMIRLDFFVDINNVDHISYQIQTNYETMKLKILIWGKGQHYNKLNTKITEDISFLNLEEISFDDDTNEIVSRIKTNFIAIDDFLKREYEIQ